MQLSPKQDAVNRYVGDIEGLPILPASGISFREFIQAHHRYPVIAITGQAGVGKTTFTKIFKQRLQEMLEAEEGIEKPGVKIVTELPQMSPYLPIIKASKDSLDQTIWEKNQGLFLHLDTAIITKAHLESQDNIIIMDFAMTQVLIYADLKIKGRTGNKFKKNSDEGFQSLPKPDLLIHISASSNAVLRRLEGRGSYIDQEIMRSVEVLNDYYNKKGIIEEYYEGIPRITVNTDSMNLVENSEDKSAATKQAVEIVLAKARLI